MGHAPDRTGANVGLGTWPARRARISPEAIALSDEHRSLTYAVMSDRTSRLAGHLARCGVGHGDRVAYLGVNSVTTLEVFFGSWLIGAIAVPLNHRLSGPEIGHQLDDSGAAVVVVDEGSADLLPADFRNVVTVREIQEATDAAEPAAAPGVAPDDPAVLLYTSGTTGRPKAAVLTHGNLTWNTVNQLAHLDVLSTDRVLCFAPLFHATGLGQVTLPTLFKGGSVEVLARFDAAAVLARIGEAGITGFSAVPTMLQLMCEHPAWPDADLSTLTTVVYGGSPVAERVARAWFGRGVRLHQGYGMTEASPGVYMQPRDGGHDRPVSVGVPHFFTDVATLRDGGRGDVDAEPGELLVRGPHVFAGYWNKPQASAEAFTDGWFRTGDVLHADADGWAYVSDRVKDVIISGGENIYPAEVEAVLMQLEDVSAAAVVAVPDPRWGEVGAAYISLRDGATVTEQDIRTHLEAHLGRYKIPRHLTFTSDLPANATGKIRRVELRARAATQFATPEAAPADGTTPEGPA